MSIRPEEIGDPSVLEEMIKAARSPEPGTVVPGDVLQSESGDSGMPPTVVNKVTSAGYFYMYDTVTGEESITNRNMLMINLQKTRKDGTRVFTTRKPAVKPRRGTLKCYLHPDQPWRKTYDQFGFPTCGKSNLANIHQQTLHMKHRHKEEYATIQTQTQEEKEKRIEKYQDAMITIAERSLAVPPPPPDMQADLVVKSVEESADSAPFLSNEPHLE